MTRHDLEFHSGYRSGQQMNHQQGVCVLCKNTYVSANLQLVCSITCTAQGGWNTTPYAAWRSLLRTPVLLHLAPRLYCDLMRLGREGRPRTYCLSTSLCSRAQKSNCTLRALHCGVCWCWSTETETLRGIKIDKQHVWLRAEFSHDLAPNLLHYSCKKKKKKS